MSLVTMITDITSKTLHEKTGQVLDRLRRGERFRVLRDGEPEALMVPVEEAIDPVNTRALRVLRRNAEMLKAEMGRWLVISSP